jgi:Tfp pilus assembly protein PilX
MKTDFKNNEKGFALPLVLLLLVVMTIMGATLVTISSNEHSANTDKDQSQQAFYAAESGISVAKKWMVDNIPIVSGSPPNNLDSKIKFCKATFFPNLLSSNNGFWTERISLSEVITASGPDAVNEDRRLGKFSFEYFIAYSPDQNGNNSSAKTKSGTNNVLYTIYSCGCDEAKDKCSAQSNVIVPLEAVVTLVN